MHAYRVFNKATDYVEIARDVTFDESNGSQGEQVAQDDASDESIGKALENMAIGEIRPQEKKDDDYQPPSTNQDQEQLGDNEQAPSDDNSKNDEEVDEESGGQPSRSVPHPRVHQCVQRDHPVENILGDIEKGVVTRSRVVNFCRHYSFVSSLEPFRVQDALEDPDWVMAMQEELNNFTRNKVWSLVERPK